MSEKKMYFCDVCETELVNSEKKDIQVIFTTEQTEGRGVKPYLSNKKIDICPDCEDIILRGNYLYGRGAQGYNKYRFKTN